MNVTPAYYLCSAAFATVESNFTTYTGYQLNNNNNNNNNKYSIYIAQNIK